MSARLKEVRNMMQMGWPMMVLMMLLCGLLLAALITLVVLAITRLARAR